MKYQDILDEIGHGRHPGVAEIMRFFAYDHLPLQMQGYSAPACQLALEMCHRLQDSPELTTGLRKLLEAKDCFVRAAL